MKLLASAAAPRRTTSIATGRNSREFAPHREPARRNADPRLHGASRTSPPTSAAGLSAVPPRLAPPFRTTTASPRRLPCRNSRPTGRSRKTTRSTSRFVEMTLDELDPGDVVVRTKYSTINYKDALSYNGAGKIMRKYPTNAGIDMAGTVETSADPRWKRGDKVHRARLRHGRRARRRLRRVRARARRLGGAAAREHDGVRRDDARHRRLHRGAGDHADGAQRPQARQRPGRRHRRDRRRRLGRGRDPRQARLPRRRDHRQAGGGRATCKELGAKEVLLRQSIDLAQDPAARQGDVGRRGRQPRRRHARVAAVDDEDRRHGRGGRPRRRT